MGALSDTRLDAAAQADHSRRLMLGPGGRRAAVAVAVGDPRAARRPPADVPRRATPRSPPELCAWIATLPRPRRAARSCRAPARAPPARSCRSPHAWGHLAGVGRPLDTGGAVPPRLGPKEGIALLAGVPTADGARRAASRRRGPTGRADTAVAAAGVVLLGASRDPYLPATARGDAELAAVLARLRGVRRSARGAPAPAGAGLVPGRRAGAGPPAARGGAAGRGGRPGARRGERLAGVPHDGGRRALRRARRASTASTTRRASTRLARRWCTRPRSGPRACTGCWTRR